jgi:ribosomal protein S18 acetylase RimI-like enzyme
MTNRIAFRPTTRADEAFVFRVRETTMRDYVVETWGVWNADEARAQINEDILSSKSKIIVIDGHDAGVLRVDEFDTHIHVDQLWILPGFQRQGFGRIILMQILEQSKAKGLPLRLWVLRVNPAKEFYERLGFSIIEQTQASLHLECAPSR